MTTKLMFKCKGLFVLFYKYIPFAIMHIIPFAIMHIVSFVKYFFLYFYQESVISPSENSKLLKIHVNQIFYLKSIQKMLFFVCIFPNHLVRWRMPFEILCYIIDEDLDYHIPGTDWRWWLVRDKCPSYEIDDEINS